MSPLYVIRSSPPRFGPPTEPVSDPLQVFDNYAVTVMIGEDPYTLGLFDTAGACLRTALQPIHGVLNPPTHVA